MLEAPGGAPAARPIPRSSPLDSFSPGFYLVIVFLTLGIACALFYLAELIEEYTSLTKRLLGHIIKVLWVCSVICWCCC